MPAVDALACMTCAQVAKSGILFRSAPPSTAPTPGEACGRFGAALLYDWRNNRLDVLYADNNGKQRLCRWSQASFQQRRTVREVMVIR